MFALKYLTFILIFTTVVSGFKNDGPTPVASVPKYDYIPRIPPMSRPYVKEGYLGNKTAYVNKTVRFMCPVVSDLEPFLYWLKPAKNYIGRDSVGEETVPDGLVIKSDDDTDKPAVLTLYNVTKKDEGWYVCVALTTTGRASARGHLTILDRIN